MKPLDRRKAVRELRRLCKAHGITILEDKGRGHGSHGSLVFSDDDGSDPVRIVIVYDREISPGVQRTITERLRDRVIGAALGEGARQLAHLVHQIVVEVFGS